MYLQPNNASIDPNGNIWICNSDLHSQEMKLEAWSQTFNLKMIAQGKYLVTYGFVTQIFILKKWCAIAWEIPTYNAIRGASPTTKILEGWGPFLSPYLKPEDAHGNPYIQRCSYHTTPPTKRSLSYRKDPGRLSPDLKQGGAHGNPYIQRCCYHTTHLQQKEASPTSKILEGWGSLSDVVQTWNNKVHMATPTFRGVATTIHTFKNKKPLLQKQAWKAEVPFWWSPDLKQ